MGFLFGFWMAMLLLLCLLLLLVGQKRDPSQEQLSGEHRWFGHHVRTEKGVTHVYLGCFRLVLHLAIAHSG